MGPGFLGQGGQGGQPAYGQGFWSPMLQQLQQQRSAWMQRFGGQQPGMGGGQPMGGNGGQLPQAGFRPMFDRPQGRPMQPGAPQPPQPAADQQRAAAAYNQNQAAAAQANQQNMAANSAAANNAAFNQALAAQAQQRQPPPY